MIATLLPPLVLVATTLFLIYLAPGLGLLVVPAVGLLWAWRWVSARRRASALAIAMAVDARNTSVAPVSPAEPALPAALVQELRAWLLQGWNTGVATLSVHHVWGRQMAGGQVSVFDLHMLPGYQSGTWIEFLPVVRRRHSAVLCIPDRPSALPVFTAWRAGWRERLDAKLGFLPATLPGGVRREVHLDAGQGSAGYALSATIHHVPAVHQVVASMSTLLEQSPSAWYLASDGDNLLLVFKKHLASPAEQVQRLEAISEWLLEASHDEP